MSVREFATKEQRDEMIRLYLEGMNQKEAAKAVGCGSWVIHKELSVRGIKRHYRGEMVRKYTINEKYFDIIDSPNKAYWLGFLGADGNISKKLDRIHIALNTIDKNHLEKFREDLQSNAPIKDIEKYTFNKKRYQSLITICSKKIGASLGLLNVVPNKTLILTPPPLEVLGDFQRDYWRGLIDGDGCINHITRCSGTFEWRLNLLGTLAITQGFTDFIKNNGIISNTGPKKRKKIYSITFGGNLNVKRILKLIYSDAQIYLDRKMKLAQECITSVKGD